jgi:tRNA pseudouridine32 synthase / 23S rRNA pseudouridine746 synthase
VGKQRRYALVVVEVVYADPALVAVNKPAGLLAVPGKGERGHLCLSAWVQEQFADALVVHRLDMPTSGLILFARGAEAQRRLSRAFAERRIDKHYVAVVHGHVVAAAGVIDAPITVDWPNRPRQHVDAVHGKPSLTRWQVLHHEPGSEPASARTRLALQPVTGRAHQLRVHLRSIGHPIVGDALYADDPALGATGEARLLLHAERLGFEHPMEGQTMTLHCPAPF